jgi:hypothetical protein
MPRGEGSQARGKRNGRRTELPRLAGGVDALLLPSALGDVIGVKPGELFSAPCRGLPRSGSRR